MLNDLHADVSIYLYTQSLRATCNEDTTMLVLQWFKVAKTASM